MKDNLLATVQNAPLFWVASAFLGGLWLGSFLPVAWWVWVLLAFGALVLGMALKFLRRAWRLYLLLLPAFLFLGAGRYAAIQPLIDEQSLAYYNDIGENVYVTGVLSEAPDERDTNTHLRLNVTALDWGEGDFPVRGMLLVRLGNPADLQYGQVIRVRGQLETPAETEEFSYREYLARQGVLSLLRTYTVTVLPQPLRANPLYAAIYRLRDRLLEEVYALFPQPEAGLMAGILLGVESGMAADLQQAFQDTGTAHIVAISGFNIALIAQVLLSLFGGWWGKKRGTLAALAGIAFYTVLVGASASVVRAALMGAVSLSARQFGRRNASINSLFLTALLMGLADAYVLWDVGFQLSFMATLGLILYSQTLQDAVKAGLERILPAITVKILIAPLSDYVLLTFAAQLTTLPVIAYHFGRLSVSSFFVNPLVLPAQPPVMILGGLAVILGAIFRPLGVFFAWLTWVFPAYTIRIVETFAQISGGVWVVEGFGFSALLLFYAILALATLYASRLWAARRLVTSSFVLLMLATLTVNLWRTSLNGADGLLHLTVLDVGSTSAVLLKTPDGRFLLINGGESANRLGDQLGRRIPPLRRQLDALIVAAPQQNQMEALPRVLEQYPPAYVLWAGNLQASYAASQLQEWLLERQIGIQSALGGETLDLGQGAFLRVLAVSPRGAILSVEWGSFRVILPMGVTYESFEMLENGSRLRGVSALLLAESGYLPANPPLWLENLQPQFFLLSVAAGDLDGLPAPALLETLEGYTLLRTDQNGWIDLATNGQDLWVTVEKEAGSDK